jgi:hypothetical protein
MVGIIGDEHTATMINCTQASQPEKKTVTLTCVLEVGESANKVAVVQDALDANHANQQAIGILLGGSFVSWKAHITKQLPGINGSNSPTPSSEVPSSSKCNIPNDCALSAMQETLRELFKKSRSTPAQFLRMAFHEAGTFSSSQSEGGCNGCLLQHRAFRRQPENDGLSRLAEKLRGILKKWNKDHSLCVSAADITQFAGIFSVVESLPSSDKSSHSSRLTSFKWGRPDLDVSKCRPVWTKNLPGFRFGKPDIMSRMKASGEEINQKMCVANGFTSKQAVALIGAHCLGKARTTFPGFGPWVVSGDDDFEGGPKFSNSFFTFLMDKVHSRREEFTEEDITPFDTNFFNWWSRSPRTGGLHPIMLDIDLALVLPQNDSTYPDYVPHVASFAGNNTFFLLSFFDAYEAMVLKGVAQPKFLMSPIIKCTTG